MKKIFLIIILICTYSATIIAQEAFVPGYYIINSNAKYAVVIPGGGDYSFDSEKGCYEQLTNLKMKAGEVVIAFEYSKGKVYCFDPNGRMLAFDNLNNLSKAPMKPGAGVCYINETIELIDGGTIQKGSYYWIVGQNIAASTITIQAEDGKTYEIPQSKIILYGVYIKTAAKELEYINVE